MRRIALSAAIALATVIVASLGYLGWEYHKFSRRVDGQLGGGRFTRTLSFYAAPEDFFVGDTVSPEEILSALRRCGYREGAGAGAYTFDSDILNITSPDGATAVRLAFAKGRIASIKSLSDGAAQPEYELGPQLITNLSDAGREKRTLVGFADLPPALVHAVVSAEDKRFFQHAGFDPFRVAKAAYVDVKDNRKEQGASTITMQLARNLWLERDKRWQRKFAELMITLHLERKLTKKEIFEYYCNQVYLGGRGTFGINGFGEAARVYFNKDVRKLNLAEAATLAGLIQRPSYFNPFRYPERARERRNIVLGLMLANGYASRPEYLEAVNAPLGLHVGNGELSDAQYFLDLAADEAQKRLEDRTWSGAAGVYTTIDLRLQRAAEQAVREGAVIVERELKKKHRSGEPQIALVALDPRTGEVKALVGGRAYADSQLNHTLSHRPPGSVFKPFVYAAALSNGSRIFSPSSTVEDAPTTFRYENQTYSPGNFDHQFHGTVTFRRALAKSLNVATVRVAEMTGYNNVVALARNAGLGDNIRATPSVALGAYEVTPLEIAGAYTIFANHGLRESPRFIGDIRDQRGRALYQARPESLPVLDERVAFLMEDMLQEVMRSGTAAGVRSLGFQLPAAGKTGTSHDGWFAGFTSELLCVVWVGFDDYRELDLEGAHSALPIWTSFMKQAARFKTYGAAKAFVAPPGVVRVSIDPESGKLATPQCTSAVSDYFMDGTQPVEHCTLHDVEIIPADDDAIAMRPITVLENVSARIRPVSR
jgi:penicillin-binding protein 1B